jgi:hypothetical protein
LEGLSYPINDQLSLGEAVAGKEIGLLGALEAADFPLVSPANAFEKLRDRLPFPFPTPPPDLPEDRPERPSIARVYEATLGPICGRRALEAYSAARRSMPELAAVIVGHWEGRKCVEELAETLREGPPPPTPRW